MGLDAGLHIVRRGPEDRRSFEETDLIYWRNQWHITGWFWRWLEAHDPEQRAHIRETGEMAYIVVTEEMILEFMGDFQDDERAMYGMSGNQSIAAALTALANGETVVYSECY